MFIPVLGVFSGAIWLKEAIHWQDWAAVALMVVAIASVLWPTRRGHHRLDQEAQLAIDTAKTLERNDLRIGLREPQRCGFLLGGRAQFLREDLRAHRAALALHFVGEAEHGRDEILVALPRRHEGAAALDLVDEVVAHQVGQGLAHHDARDAELVAKLGFGWQLGADGQHALQDLQADRIAELGPQRGLGVAVEHGRQGVVGTVHF
jgi:hypothetical protein